MVIKLNNRYSRHVLLEEIGDKGQEILSKSRVVVIGAGALGNTISNILARAGVGYIKVVDRDIVELNNLQRQTLFEEKDVGKPKALVSARKLRRINSTIRVDGIVEDVNYSNIEKIIKKSNVVLDGTDNMETRFLINDACIKHKIPWVYSGAIGTYGMTMSIIPNKTPCFRCLLPHLPKAGTMPTCDTTGVLNTIPLILGSIGATEGLKIVLKKKNINKNLLIYDVWTHDFQRIEIKQNIKCKCCVKQNFEFLNAEKKDVITSLCGQNAIQINPIRKGKISFEELVQKLRKLGEVEASEIIIKFKINRYDITIFRSGRAIIYGASDEKRAKSLYSKYIGC